MHRTSSHNMYFCIKAFCITPACHICLVRNGFLTAEAGAYFKGRLEKMEVLQAGDWTQ